MHRKIVILAALTFMGVFGVNAEDKTSASVDVAHEQTDSIAAAPVMTLLNPNDQDMGEIRLGLKKEVKLRFRNDGNSPLVIVRAFPDCGCTSVRYPDDPIEPGEEGEVTLIFNSRGQRTGNFLKTVKFKTNTARHIERIYLTGRVTD